MEPIAKVERLNGQSIPSERKLVKADFSSGDKVVIRFQNRDYSGVVDFSHDGETITQRVDSPRTDSGSQGAVDSIA